VFQDQPGIPCPSYPYEVWKAAAQSGEAGMHYYAWCGGGFCRDGTGPPGSVQEQLSAHADRESLHFFDTADGLAPRDDDGDGAPDNLTPPASLGPQALGRGFVYLNAQVVVAQDVGVGGTTQIAAPAEIRGGGGSAWINLVYPGSIGEAVASAGSGTFDGGGPPLTVPVSFHGVLVTSGAFQAAGDQLWVGSVVARGGVSLATPPLGPPPRFYWDAALLGGPWPPRSWRLPRTAVVSFRVDP
jgi:hypothetical protein